MSFNPEEWTPRKRASFMAHALSEFLTVVPTERTAWQGPPELVREGEDKARQISDVMDAVYGKPRDWA